MLGTKEEFLKSFLPESVVDIVFAQINLDITDLSLSDILRNIDSTYPKNSRRRNMMASGTAAVGVLCKTETLNPMNGLFLLVTGNHINVQLASRRYIVLCVDESKIGTDIQISHTVEKITNALVTQFQDDIDNLGDFYRKYIYDPYEEEEHSDDFAIAVFND